jgi:hypothetical protein
MNFLVKYLCIDYNKFESIFISSSYNKCLKVYTSVYKNKKLKKLTLRIENAMIYAPGCTLDPFTQDDTDKKLTKLEKGFFL